MKSVKLTLLFILHLLVDGVCIATVAHFSIDKGELFLYALIYNLIAFGAQPILGMICDRWKLEKQFVLLGAIVVALVIFGFKPTIFIIFMAVGNALFHVGGGRITILLAPDKSKYLGIFVAGGAIGVGLGLLFEAVAGYFALAIMLALSVLIFFNFKEVEEKKTRKSIAFLPIMMLLLSVALRGYVGASLPLDSVSTTALSIVLAVSIACGKGIGGFLADRLGIYKSVLFFLLPSIVFMCLGNISPVFAIIGALLFNTTMPMTLYLLVKTIDGNYAFTFGAAAAFLMIGAVLGDYVEASGAMQIVQIVLFTVIQAVLILASVYLTEGKFWLSKGGKSE